MKSILRSTAILTSGSVVHVGVGLVTAKVVALLVGPTGFGVMGLLQSVLGLLSLVTGMGIGPGLVKLGAKPAGDEDTERIGALRHAAVLLLSAFGASGIVALVVLRDDVSVWLVDANVRPVDILILSAALMFSLATGLHSSTLSTYRRVESLAKSTIIGSLLSGAATVLVIYLLREQGIAAAMLAGAAMTWIATFVFARRQLGRNTGSARRAVVRSAAAELMRFGGPYTASMLVGGGVLYIIPLVIVHDVGPEGVGFYRASLTITMGYPAFILAAMAQDYYPRLSAVSDRPDLIVDLVNQQHRLVMFLVVPLILLVSGVAPVLVPLIYTAQFSPAVPILEWQLFADLFKFSSWTMSFAILARTGSGTYFFTEFVGGVATLVGSWFGLRMFGLAGLGIGYFAAYVLYEFLVWWILRRDVGLRWTWENTVHFLVAFAALTLVQTLSVARLGYVRIVMALVFAVAIGIYSSYSIWKIYAGAR